MSGDNGVIAALLPREPRFTSLYARGHERIHRGRQAAAFLGRAREFQGELLLRFAESPDKRQRGDPVDAETDDQWAMWIEPPDRMRVEFVVGAETVTAVFKGAHWWSWKPAQGGLTNNGQLNLGHGRGPGEILVRPPEMAGAFEFELVGTAPALGRSASRARAWPSAGAADNWAQSAVLHQLGSGADEYELLIDQQVGIVLRLEARVRGEAFRVVEITELFVDESIDANMFELHLPDGETFKEPPRFDFPPHGLRGTMPESR